MGLGAPTNPSEIELSPGMRIRPSSISKPPPSHDSLTLRNEGSSNASVPSSHTGNTSQSDNVAVRPESPYQGPSGPSHPYEMYPQRTMSMATTSTAANAVIPDDRSYPSSRGPTHPYALYTQNVSSGDTSDASIPVGFNAHGATYQRQIGPDGEEAGDMIGPLGHMEELPPYTRYADNAYIPKITTQTPTTESLATPTPTTQTPISEPTSPIQANNQNRGPAIAGAGGIGIATRDPEFSSTDDDLALPRTRPSVSDNSLHDINTAARDVAEKSPQNKWQRRAKRKLWGIIPYWAICLVTVGLILMGIIMGAVIGTLLSRHKGPPPPPYLDDSGPTSTTTVQITPLNTIPADLPALETGIYVLPNLESTLRLDSCLNDTTQSNAWSCEMPSTQFKIKVLKDNNPYSIFLAPNKYFKLRYGAQPPSFSESQALMLVNDTTRGPAWWYRATYDKTVLVAERYFKTTKSNKKRGWDPEGHDDDDPYYGYPSPGRYGKDFSQVKDGEKPWLCTYHNTSLDVFLYAGETVKTVFTATTTSDSYSTTQPPQPSGYPKPLPPYPQVFKMKERRFYEHENDEAATCRQVEIYNDGTEYKFVSNNHQNDVELIEKESPWPEDYYSLYNPDISNSRRWAHELLPRTTEEQTDCSCIWIAA